MKRFALLILTMFLPLIFAATPIVPAEPVQADHTDYSSFCVEGFCGVEVTVRLSDPSVEDATITWRRAVEINPQDIDPSYEINSGTFEFHDVEGDPHYHTGLIYVAGDGQSFLGCDRGEPNNLIFNLNEVSNIAVNTICDLDPPIDSLELDFDVDATPTLGSVEITINDQNGLLDQLLLAGIDDCELVNNTTGDTFDCFDLLSDDQGVLNGLTLVFIDLPPGDYTFTMNYAEECLTAFAQCTDEDYTVFDQFTTTFTIEAGETTQVSVDVIADQPGAGAGNDGRVPEAPEPPPLPCDDGSLNNPLEWIVCPVVNLLFQAIDVFYRNLFIPLLEVSPLDENQGAGSPEGTVFDVWNSIRIIANIFFVIAFLFAIFGQSLSGFSNLSAYDIRKILPRLVIGIIGIQLSWYVVAFMVDLFNILGAGVRGLVLAPVNGLEGGFEFDMASAWQELAVIIGITGAAVVALWVGGILMGLPLILFPILLGLVLAFLTILARRVLILVLIVAAPLAFVAWILPNTAGLFRKWWEYFWKALLVYPLILLLIAAGELMARVTWEANSTDVGTQQGAGTALIAMIALFAPYFLIPFVFRLAGGILAETANGLDRRGKTLNQRMFGTQHDEGSWRGRRRTVQTDRRARRKSRVSDAATNMSNSNSRLRRGAGKTIGFINARTGGGAAAINAQRMAEARAWGAEMTGSARDEEVWAQLSDYNIQSGGRLTQEAIDKADRKNNFKTQFALEYAIGKANDADVDLEPIIKRFMHGDTIDGKHVSFSGGMSEPEKRAAYSRAVDKMQPEYGDFKYRDPYSLEMSKDPTRLTRFAKEVNNRKTDGRTISKQRATYWNGVEDASNTARQIYERNGGSFSGGRFGGGFNAAGLQPDERRFLREMGTMRAGLRGDSSASGASAKANEARGRAARSLAWLDDPALRGL